MSKVKETLGAGMDTEHLQAASGSYSISGKHFSCLFESPEKAGVL